MSFLKYGVDTNVKKKVFLCLAEGWYDWESNPVTGRLHHITFYPLHFPQIMKVLNYQSVERLYPVPRTKRVHIHFASSNVRQKIIRTVHISLVRQVKWNVRRGLKSMIQMVHKYFGNLNLLEPLGHTQACRGTALPFLYMYIFMHVLTHTQFKNTGYNPCNHKSCAGDFAWCA